MNSKFELIKKSEIGCTKTYNVKVIECGTYTYIDGIGHSNKCFYLCLLYFLMYEMEKYDITILDLFKEIYEPKDKSGLFEFFDTEDIKKLYANNEHTTNDTIQLSNLKNFLSRNNIRLSIFNKNFEADNIKKIEENKIIYKILNDNPQNFNIGGVHWLKLFNTGGHYQIIDSIKNKNGQEVEDLFYNHKYGHNNECFIVESVYIDVYLKEKILELIEKEEYDKIMNYLYVENLNYNPEIINTQSDKKFFSDIINNNPTGDINVLKDLMLNYTSVINNKSNNSLNAEEIKNKIIDVINNFNTVKHYFNIDEKKANFNLLNEEIHELLKLLYAKEENLIHFNGDENNIDKYLNDLFIYIKNPNEYYFYDNYNRINNKHDVYNNPNDDDNKKESPLKSNNLLIASEIKHNLINNMNDDDDNIDIDNFITLNDINNDDEKAKKNQNLINTKILAEFKTNIENMYKFDEKNNQFSKKKKLKKFISENFFIFENNKKINNYFITENYYKALQEIKKILKLIHNKILYELKEHILNLHTSNIITNKQKKINKFIKNNFIDDYLLIFKNKEILDPFYDISPDFLGALNEIKRIINSNNTQIPLESNMPVLEYTAQQIVPKIQDLNLLHDEVSTLITEIDVEPSVKEALKNSILDNIKNNKLINTYSNLAEPFYLEEYELLMKNIKIDIDIINNFNLLKSELEKDELEKYEIDLINYYHENIIKSCSPREIIKNMISKFLKKAESMKIEDEDMDFFKKTILDIFNKGKDSDIVLLAYPIDEFKNKDNDYRYNMYLIKDLLEYLNENQYGGLKKYTLTKRQNPT
jgi:hypothetical protein